MAGPGYPGPWTLKPYQLLKLQNADKKLRLAVWKTNVYMVMCQAVMAFFIKPGYFQVGFDRPNP